MHQFGRISRIVTPRTLNSVMFVLLLLITLLPVLVAVLDPPVLETGHTWSGWIGVAAVIADHHAREALINSLVVGCAVGILAVPLSAGLAFGMLRPHLRMWILGVLAISLLTPGEATAIAWGAVDKWLGIVVPGDWTVDDGFKIALVVVAHVGWVLPFSTAVALAGLLSIPQSVLHSAQDLGAGPCAVVGEIVLRLWWPALLSSFLFGLLLSYNEYTRTAYLSGAVEFVSEFMYGKLMSGMDPPAIGMSLTGLSIWLLAIGSVGLAVYLRHRMTQRDRRR